MKTYGINGTEALTGDWKELNKETYVCNPCYKTTSRFTSVRIYKLITCLYLYLPEDIPYSPSEKQPINLFTQFWQFSDFKSIKKRKIDVTLILSITTKEKSDQILKSEKLFLFFYDFDCFSYSLYYFNCANMFIQKEIRKIKWMSKLCFIVFVWKLNKILSIDKDVLKKSCV